MRVKLKRLTVITLLLAACMVTFTWLPNLYWKETSTQSLRRVILRLSDLFERQKTRIVTDIVINETEVEPVWDIKDEIRLLNKSRNLQKGSSVFSNFSFGDPPIVTLRDIKKEYFTSGCLTEGTKNFSSVCQCKTGWHGESCSIPDFVDENKFRNSSRPVVRSSRPRRIIYGITFNIEFEMLELRFGEVGDLIDAIIIVESNYTGFGQPKKLYLLEMLKQGFLYEHQHKIVYLCMNFFPTGRDPKDGRYTDFYTKNYVSREGLQYIKGQRDDDIFITSDADELHRREALLFLKLHGNYPEPVGGYLRRNVFGFFWSSGFTVLGFACSLRMLSTVYNNKSSEIRGATSQEHLYISSLEKYDTKWHNAQMWQMGEAKSVSKIAGWHCSWCLDPVKVRIKLLSAYNYDFPRWGSYPEKTKLDYIRDLIKVGLWFDNKSTYVPQYITKHTPYAPRYALQHFKKFRHLLLNPFRKL